MIAEWEPEQHSAAITSQAARSHAWGWFGGVVIGVAILLMAFSAGARWLEAARWDPLGDYPLQTVFSGDSLPQNVDPATTLAGSSSGTGPPSFYIDQEINIFGTKCVKTGVEGLSTVQVKGTLSWVSDNPVGRIIEVGSGGGTRGPGCITSTFNNPIPEVVLKEIERLAEKGITESDWHLTGTEVPVRTVDGVEEEGVSRTWISTTFRVIASDAP